MKVKAIIGVYVEGKSQYNRSGEYIAIIEPAFFKNGNMKKTGFKEIKQLEVTKKWYDKFAKRITYSIKEVLETIDSD